MAKKKNGKNKGKITRERNKVIDSLRFQNKIESDKKNRQNARITQDIQQDVEQ